MIQWNGMEWNGNAFIGHGYRGIILCICVVCVCGAVQKQLSTFADHPARSMQWSHDSFLLLTLVGLIA